MEKRKYRRRLQVASNNKEMEEQSNTKDQINVIDTYRTFYPTRTEYTFFSGAHEIFSRIDCILGQKTGLMKCNG